MPRIVLYAVTVSYLFNHSQVVVCATLDTLSFEQLTFLLKLLELSSQFGFDCFDGLGDLFFVCDEVLGWEKENVLFFCDDMR